MRVIIRLILVFYISLWPSLARDKKVSFDAQAALSYIKELASDSMMGRESGQASGVMAEEYIASRLKEWGVEPGGENGTYFQHLNINHYNIAAGVKFEVVAEKARRNFYYRDDWRVWRFSGSGHFTAEIVFVGYGIHAPEKGYDDYAGVNVDGKIVLLILETPISLEENFQRNREGGALILNLRDTSTVDRQIVVEYILGKLVELLTQWKIRAVFLFAEEAHLYLRETYWDDIVTRMRHLGVFTTFVTNQPNTIRENIYRQADNIFLFNFTNEHDLEAVSRATKVDAETVKSIARDLPPHHCLVLGNVVKDFPIAVKVRALDIQTMGQTRLFFIDKD